MTDHATQVANKELIRRYSSEVSNAHKPDLATEFKMVTTITLDDYPRLVERSACRGDRHLERVVTDHLGRRVAISRC